MAEATANERQHAPGQHPDLPPPSMSVGVIGWVRQNLLSSPLNWVLTIISILLIYWVLEGALTWAVFDAQISGDSRTDCTNEGACWALIRVRFNQFMFGFYPAEHYWRVILAGILMIAALVPVLFETHRNCITNDLFYTLQLMDAVPEMPICADLSHYVVDREFWYPLSDGDQALIERILVRAESFQGRVAGREQVQLQLDFPQHQRWVELFKSWWARGFGHWRRRHGPGDTLIFLTELGPPEYAITGADGFELSDRWLESLTLKRWARALWTEAGESAQAAD